MLANLSIEELLDLEDEIREELEEDNVPYGSYDKLIGVYEALYRKIKQDKNSDYAESLPTIENRLIAYLVDYGTYMKTVYQKDDQAARHSLQKAIRYNRKLPIVHYRLGFLEYKRKAYQLALIHFQNAIQQQKMTEEGKYSLNPQQLYNCHLYLANCGLFIAKKANESLEKLKEKGAVIAQSLHYEISPLYQIISDNEQYLKNHACQMVTKNESRYCSKEECDDKALQLKNTIILDLTGRENLLIFNGKETNIMKNHAEMLRYFFLHSNEVAPVTKQDLYDLFSQADDNGEIPTNTYTKNVSRLRAKLKNIGIDSIVIENKAVSTETAYFYNHHYPFLIMHRSYESFIL